MNDCKEEKRDLEEFINGTIKKLSPENKQKAAYIIQGMTLAQENTEKHSSVDVSQRS